MKTEHKTVKYALPAHFTVTAHSGCLDLPANSVEAMAAGVAAGANIVEFDLQFAGDGTPVCSHDAPAESAVPVRDVFAFLRLHPDVQANVDVKDPSHLDAVQALAEETGVLQQLFYTGVHDAFVEPARSLSPKIPYYLNAHPEPGTSLQALADRCAAAGAIGINLDKSHLTPALVSCFHARGMLVSVYTVNTLPELRRALACGPDNVTSLRPDLVFAEING